MFTSAGGPIGHHRTLGEIFLSEVIGHSDAAAARLWRGRHGHAGQSSKGEGGGWLLINFGWGLAVFVGVYVAFRSGAHLNPAVTLGLAIAGNITFAQSLVYYRGRTDRCVHRCDPGLAGVQEALRRGRGPGKKLGVFSTGPAIRSYALEHRDRGHRHLRAGLLDPGVAGSADPPVASSRSRWFVALVVVGIGASLGGPTGYAINPARDLGPRIAHAILPIKGKGSRTGLTPGCRLSAR